MIIDVNWSRVEFVLDVLLQRLAAREYPYNRPDAAITQDRAHMPKNMEFGGKVHASFLFHLCYYMRGSIKSNTAARLLSRLYDDCPELFDFDFAADLEVASLAELLKKYRLGFNSQEIAQFWVENARRMSTRYNADPRNLFEGISTYEQALLRIKSDGKGGGFLGFQEKMVSMLIYFLSEQELINPMMFPPPVDFHVCRVWLANELFVLPAPTPGENLYVLEILDEIRATCTKYASAHGVNPLRLSEALWLLSMTLCSEQPGNVTLEYTVRDPDGTPRKMLRAAPVRPASQSHRLLYANTCARCPLEQTCSWNIGSALYYRFGKLARRSARQRLCRPDEQLRLIDD